MSVSLDGERIRNKSTACAVGDPTSHSVRRLVLCSREIGSRLRGEVEFPAVGFSANAAPVRSLLPHRRSTRRTLWSAYFSASDMTPLRLLGEMECKPSVRKLSENATKIFCA